MKDAGASFDLLVAWYSTACANESVVHAIETGNEDEQATETNKQWRRSANFIAAAK